MMRTPDGSQKLILGCLAVATTNNVVANLQKSGERAPAPKIVIGGFGIAIGLLVASEFSPELAEAIAVLILVASLVGPNGDALVKLMTRLTTDSRRATPSTRPKDTTGSPVHLNLS